MKIGIYGSGRIAKAFAGHVAKAGYEVLMTNRTGPSALNEIVRQLGPTVKAATGAEVATADIILMAVPWESVPAVLASIPEWDRQIMLDATNAVSFPSFAPLDLGGKTSSRVLAELAPGARVVKAFNTLEAATLAADPHYAGGNRVVFISSDDPAAKGQVLALLNRLGFAGIDLGGLDNGGKMQSFGGPFTGKNLIKLPA